MFSVGRLTDPRADDAEFGEWDQAIQAAARASNEDACEVWAVWEDECGEIKAVVYVGLVFT